MRVTKLTYGATRANNNYGNDRLEVEVELAEGEDPAEAFRRAQSFVLRRLEGKIESSRAMALTVRDEAQRRLEQLDPEIPF